MMKCRIFFIIIFFVFIDHAAASIVSVDTTIDYAVKIIYEVTSRPDSSDQEKYNSEYCLLLIDRGYGNSMYTADKYIRMDSMMRAERNRGNNLGPSMGWYDANGTRNSTVVLKDLINKHVVVHESLPRSGDGEHFVYENADSLDWLLYDEVREIFGAKCFRADVSILGRKWTAWYNPEVPIADGPHTFYGLPGLIYMIEDRTGSWKFEVVNMNSEIGSFSFNCTNHTHTFLSKDEFHRRKRYYMDNRILVMKAKGWVVSGDEASLERQYKKDNNWIELIP